MKKADKIKQLSKKQAFFLSADGTKLRKDGAGHVYKRFEEKTTKNVNANENGKKIQVRRYCVVCAKTIYRVKISGGGSRETATPDRAGKYASTRGGQTFYYCAKCSAPLCIRAHAGSSDSCFNRFHKEKYFLNHTEVDEEDAGSESAGDGDSSSEDG